MELYFARAAARPAERGRDVRDHDPVNSAGFARERRLRYLSYFPDGRRGVNSPVGSPSPQPLVDSWASIAIPR